MNEADRKNYYKDLLDHTGLLKCSHGFLQLVVRSYTKVLSEDDCQSAELYTSELLAWTCGPERDKRKTIIALGNKANKYFPNKNILQLDFDKNTIKEIGSLPDIFTGCYPGRCSTPYGMFSGGGGFNKFDGSVICALLDVPSTAYLWLPDQPVPVSYALAVFVNGKVYVLGGCHTTNPMHRLDLQTLHWIRCANVPQPSHPAVCSVGAMIYIRGCLVPAHELMTYSTINDVWSVEKGLPSCLKCATGSIAIAVPTASDICFFSSTIHGSQCVRYDTYSKQWVELAAFPARHDIWSAAWHLVCSMTSGLQHDIWSAA